MTNEQYISALRKALSAMDKKSRTEIIKEIQSELGETDNSLLERFGPVEDLAKQYLEGEDLPEKITSTAAKAGKGFIFWFGMLVIALFVSGAIFMWIMSGDDFDYSNTQSEQLDLASSEWQTVDWTEPVELLAVQAQAIIYWHDKPVIRYKCEGGQSAERTETGFKLMQNQCFFFLPKQSSRIDALQAQVVIVNPNAPVSVDLQQANLRIAENEQAYQYHLDLEKSYAEDLNSMQNADTTIMIKALESSITHYQY